jgi:hypothetical protein
MRGAIQFEEDAFDSQFGDMRQGDCAGIETVEAKLSQEAAHDWARIESETPYALNSHQENFAPPQHGPLYGVLPVTNWPASTLRW